MKIVVISDVHSNFAALTALPEHYDELWCIGDLVDYGPRPHEVIQWIRQNATIVLRGNHDHAVGFDADPKCSPAFKRLADETKQFTQRVCAPGDIAYLRSLPTQKQLNIGSTSFYLVHAIPSDPLFGYCPEDSERWLNEAEWIDSDVLIVGHTHTPFVREIEKTTIVNPGSLGQPKTGRSMACYAVWQDGEIFLKEYEYPLAETVAAIREMPLLREDQDALIGVLQTGICQPRGRSNFAPLQFCRNPAE